jgi:hypothetical protein
VDDEVTVNREKLIAIFTAWNEKAREGNWEDRDDPEASADFFLELARQ